MTDKLIILAAFAASLSLAGAKGQEPDLPSPEEAKAQCVVEITKASEAQGEDPSQADAICDCLVPKIAESETLIAEVQSNGGLPAPGAASEALDAVVKSCLPA